MTEIKDKDLEQAAGGAPEFNKPTSPDTSKLSTPTTENGYCEHFAQKSLDSEKCCRNCAYSVGSLGKILCNFN